MKKTVPVGAFLLPETARKVFNGQIFDVYQWPQTMFDGSTKTFEMLKRPDTVQVVVIRDGALLLVEDEQPGRAPQIHFPGGRTDTEDESWLAAAQRELLEETGLTCQNWKLIDVQQPLAKAEWFTPIYLVTDILHEQEQQLDQGGERISLLWKSFEEVRKEVLESGSRMMQYLIPLFSRLQTLEQLLVVSEFSGQEIDTK